MAIYRDRDIETDINGDLVLSSNGDLSLANPLVTYKAAANFVLRTDFGDYAPDSSVGSNLGSFVGKTMTSENMTFMEYNITKCLRERIFSPTDVDTTVVPFDINEVLCVVSLGGSFLIDGVITAGQGETITYTFPYIDGRFITPLTIE